jgi:hypothetical protein
MLTLEIYERLVTWPEDFALMMMNNYQNHGVPFIVHSEYINPGRDSTTYGLVAKCVALADALVNIRCRQ